MADQATPVARWRRASVFFAATVVVAVGLSLWMTSRAWGGRPPAGDDVQGHLVRATWGLHHAVLALRLDSWFPRFMAGHQEYLLYGPGFDWMLALVRLATFGLLSDAGAMKALQILSCAALAPCGYYLARSFGFSPRAASLGAVLVLAVDSPFGVGYQSTFVIGLVPEQVAAPFFLLALGSLWRVISRPRVTRRDGKVAVAACVALVLTHPISVLVLAVMFAMAIIPRVLALRVDVFHLGRLVFTGLVIAGLTAFWLLPYLAHRNLRGPVATWTTPTLSHQLGDIFHGHLLFARGMGALVVVAVAVSLLGAMERPALRAPAAVGWAGLGYLLAAHADIELQPHSDQALILANRGLGYAGIAAALVVAWWIAAAADYLIAGWGEDLDRSPARAAAGDLVLGTCAVVIAAGIVIGPLHGRRVAKQAPVPVGAMSDAAAVLQREVPPTARFAVERDFPGEIQRTGVSQPNLWLANHTSRNELNVFNGESSASAGVGYVPDEIHTGGPEAVASRLAPLGVTHLVTVDPATAARYGTSPRWSPVWSEGPLAILALTPVAGQPDPATLVVADGHVDVRWLSTSVEHPRWQLSSDGARVVTIALAYSPKWHARVDGRSTPLRPAGGFKLLGLQVPAGAHRVSLDFRPDRVDWLGRLITLATMLALLAPTALRRWRRSPLAPRLAARLPARITGRPDPPDESEGSPARVTTGV